MGDNSPRFEGGCFLISRKLIDSDIMCKPPNYLKVWIYMLSKAYFKDHGNLKRGQNFITINEIRDVLSYYVGFRKIEPSRKEVMGILNWLRESHEGTHEGHTKVPMIVTTKVTHGMVYTVVNYNDYQELSNYEGTSEGLAKVARRSFEGHNIKKNVNNVKNDNKKTFSSDSEEYRLSHLLYSFILKRNENQKEPNFQTWAKQIDLMIRKDKREPSEIQRIITWCQCDSFWKNNILSTKKLRDKYDQLNLKSKEGGNWSQQPDSNEADDGYDLSHFYVDIGGE